SQVLRDKSAQGVPVLFSSHQLDLVQRLCDRVGIVRSGTMVACGSVDELRSGTNTQLVADAPEAPLGWAEGLPGVRVQTQDGTRAVLELSAGADDQVVLKTALSTGPVREFARRRPSLVDLFRSVVNEETAR
ncbi:MAG TPA: DUF4162 domain-containing protein, partial [Pseudonocardiaceae bacterium]|nr:DUF4162 domain-containing protein [Pseudonocardiaceae bacterium]